MRFVPAFLQPYIRLARLDKPTGWWLLLFPAWWSAAMAAPIGHLPNPPVMFLFLIGAIVMRGAGCAINDVMDRNMDAQVARTKTRPVASGAVSPIAAIIFALFLTLIGLAVVVQMGQLPLVLAVASLPLILLYPLMKRFTWWPQAFLGLVFNWGALMGSAAITGRIITPAIILYIACFFWTLAYDTIYAFQDKDDDGKAGIKSTARLLGAGARKWVGLWYGLFLILLTAAGMAAQLGLGFYGGMAITLFIIASIMRQWRMEEATSSLGMFRANTGLGWCVLLSIIAGLFTAAP